LKVEGKKKEEEKTFDRLSPPRPRRSVAACPMKKERLYSRATHRKGGTDRHPASEVVGRGET